MAYPLTGQIARLHALVDDIDVLARFTKGVFRYLLHCLGVMPKEDPA